MNQTWHFYDHETRDVEARRHGDSRWVKVKEGDCEAVIFLNDEQTRTLIAELQATLEPVVEEEAA